MVKKIGWHSLMLMLLVPCPTLVEPKANFLPSCHCELPRLAVHCNREGIKNYYFITYWALWQRRRDKEISKKMSSVLTNGKNKSIDTGCIMKLCVKIDKVVI